MKAVLDTNVVISAVLIKGSIPEEILSASSEGLFELVTSPALIEEIRRVVGRDRIRNRVGWGEAEAAEFVERYGATTTVVAPVRAITVIDVDEADNRVLEAAIEGQVDYVVSGDHHLLDLGEFEGIRVVSPARFTAILEADA